MKRFLRNNNAGHLVGVRMRKTPRDEETPLKGTPPVEDFLVLRAGESRGHSERPLDLRQTLTALGATSCENLAPTLCRLAGAISDFPFPLDFGRLPCHLHDFCSFRLKLKFKVYFIIFQC